MSDDITGMEPELGGDLRQRQDTLHRYIVSVLQTDGVWARDLEAEIVTYIVDAKAPVHAVELVGDARREYYGAALDFGSPSGRGYTVVEISDISLPDGEARVVVSHAGDGRRVVFYGGLW
jgi:hypothetical protein